MKNRPDPPTIYRVTVKGHLDARRAADLGGLRVVHNAEGTTTLIGPIADQSALYGLITRLRDMGVELINIDRVGPSDDPDPAEGLERR